ncbi:MAG: hypothetical protein KME15_23200 [Drouetiella hepatica Uher 2000/2452]|uniref:Uncharacterized protein n=1 Tax=Drouetiella hepatica Uher 2000/2452 TaxID=904376 RepID=A0A951QE50_9CYAN|nr:hypothetical protein [Drouetiella hepatica Uher 2000/2452]
MSQTAFCAVKPVGWAANLSSPSWVDRSIPDAELDSFVERLARRIAGFDRQAIATAKQSISQRTSLPTLEDIGSSETKFFEAASHPTTWACIRVLLQSGLQQPTDFELHIGEPLDP